jgi:acyl-CoA oxidase
MQEIEALAAGMKAYSTWSTTAVLQECREAIGKGYLSENRIDALKMILKSTPLLRVIIQY